MEAKSKFKNVCAGGVAFKIDKDKRVTDINFTGGGCNGNLGGIASLCEGMQAEEIISRLSGKTCGFKSTSCPDQFAQALKEELKRMDEQTNDK